MFDTVPTVAEVLIAVVAVLISLVLAVVFIKKTRSTQKTLAKAIRRTRKHALLVGLLGSGKTTMFAKLVHGEAADNTSTRTSMVRNEGTVALPSGGSASVVDYPGHRRLREGLLDDALAEAKSLVLVVDSIMIQDDREEGGSAVADLLCDLVSSPQFNGVKSILVACTKRDEMTSYSAKSVRKVLEEEIARQLTTRDGSVGALGNRADADGSADVFMLNEAGKFSFDTAGVPITFANVASKESDSSNFNLDPVVEFLGTM